jgi:hypothetical protein
MISELKVYSKTGELILHIRYAPDELFPLQIVDGTTDMKGSVLNVSGHDFDRTVFKNRQPLRFVARWGSSDYVHALAGYWAANFGWPTKVTEVGTELISARNSQGITIWSVSSSTATGKLEFLGRGQVAWKGLVTQISDGYVTTLGSLAGTYGGQYPVSNFGELSFSSGTSANEFSSAAKILLNDPLGEPVLTESIS